MACRFCEAMESNRKVYKISSEWLTDAERNQYGKYMIEYTVAIVKRTWYKKKGKATAGRTTQYRYRGIGFDLNYCPECGRKVKGNK